MPAHGSAGKQTKAQASARTCRRAHALAGEQTHLQASARTRRRADAHGCVNRPSGVCPPWP
eukprot:372541-Pleurochrysis_carterae.AAC.1